MSECKQIHISIDDCQGILVQLIIRNYDSLWNVRKLAFLKRLHELFGAKFTLFVFLNFGEYTLADIPDKYREEFLEASDWLHIQFHSISEKDIRNVTYDNFEESFVLSQKQIARFATRAALSGIIRLHYWYYPIEYVKVLKSNSIKVILTKEKDSTKYELCSWNNTIWIEKDGFSHSLKKVAEHDFRYPMVVLTHEWAMSKKTLISLLLICLWAFISNKEFIN